MEKAYLILGIIYWIVKIVVIVHVLMDNRQPAKTMAWALVVFFVPIVGIVLYFFFGLNTRREKMMSERSLNQLSKRQMLEFVERDELKLPEAHRQMIDLFYNQNYALPFKDNEIEIMTCGHDFVIDLLKEIRRATQHIHIDMYIFEDDALGRLIADALADKVRQGVEVRVIYDDVGCWRVNHKFFERMREEGIEVCPFLPVRFPTFTSKVNYRNHRKIIVVDGMVGFIGGMNIALRYVKGINGQAWRDTMLKIRGSAVYGLQRAFLIDWFFVDRTLISNRKYYPPHDGTIVNDCMMQIVTSGPITPYPEIMQGYVRLILVARRYVYIETPYFLPNESVLFALETAALGGVDVRIMVPMVSDTHFVQWASRSYLRQAIKAGVKVYLYSRGFMHSKFLVSDDIVSTCGSTNIDFRSFENNFEGNAFIYDETVARKFKAMFLDDQKDAIMLNEIQKFIHCRFLDRLCESVTRLLSPLL